MQFITNVFGILAILGAAMAQVPSDIGTLPTCGQTCIQNLFADAAQLGCSNGNGEGSCLCGNANFTYGIRDCSNEACGDSTAATSVIDWGLSYCSSNGVTIPTTVATTTSGTVTGAPTTTETAVISSFTSTLTSDGSTLTTTGSTTITSGPVSSSISSVVSSIQSSGSSAISSLQSSVSSAISSATASSSTSSGFAPQVTAAPVGFLAAAGIAAMLL